MRRRAQAVLGHHRGASIQDLATLFAVRDNTVSEWLRHWQKRGLAGLAEGERSGRPPKLPPPIKKVVSWLQDATQQLRAWLPDIRRAWGIRLSMSTLRRLVRRQGYPLEALSA